MEVLGLTERKAGEGERVGGREIQRTHLVLTTVTLSQMPLADSEHLHFKWRSKKWKGTGWRPLEKY